MLTCGVVLGIEPSAGEPIDVTDHLTVAPEATSRADVVVRDRGGSQRAEDRAFAVLRGPKYLGVWRPLRAPHRPRGIILIAEEGRAITAKDVADVTGIPVVAACMWSARVARAVDAGLLPTAAQRLRDLAPLNQWTADLLDPFPDDPSRLSATRRHVVDGRHSPEPRTVDMTGTDLPVPTCGTGRHRAGVAITFQSALCRGHRWRRSAEHRAPRPGRCRVLGGGHSSTRVTQDMYIHVRGDMFDRFLKAPGSSSSTPLQLTDPRPGTDEPRP